MNCKTMSLSLGEEKKKFERVSKTGRLEVMGAKGQGPQIYHSVEEWYSSIAKPQSQKPEIRTTTTKLKRKLFKVTGWWKSGTLVKESCHWWWDWCCNIVYLKFN